MEPDVHDMGPSAKDRKATLRVCLTSRRAAASAERRAAADAAIVQRVVRLPEYARSSLLLTYLAMGEEVETRGLIGRAWADGKAVALPRCLPGRRLAWQRIESLDGLVRSPFGVEEPPDDPGALVDLGAAMPDAWPPDARSSGVWPSDASVSDVLAIVPGLAFDRQGYRVGYGGGFYDTFLAGFGGSTIGLCRSGLLSDDLGLLGALEPHDLPVQVVVTDTEALRTDA